MLLLTASLVPLAPQLTGATCVPCACPPAGLEERVLRAATIAAVQQVTAAANSATGSAPLTPYELSCYLCLQAEEGQPLHGKVQHHLTTGTTAY